MMAADTHLGHDEAVIASITWVVSFVAHSVEKQHRHKLCCTAARGGVSEEGAPHTHKHTVIHNQTLTARPTNQIGEESMSVATLLHISSFGQLCRKPNPRYCCNADRYWNKYIWDHIKLKSQRTDSQDTWAIWAFA